MGRRVVLFCPRDLPALRRHHGQVMSMSDKAGMSN